MPFAGIAVSSSFLNAVFSCCYVLLLTVGRAQGKIIRPTSAEIYLTSGAQLHITCEHQSPTPIKSETGPAIIWSKAGYSGGGNSSSWPKDRDLSYQTIDTTGQAAPYTINQRPGVGTTVISDLVKDDVTLLDSGFYRCHLGIGGPSNRILVTVVDISTKDGFLERNFNDTVLECSVADQSGKSNHTITWYKHGVGAEEHQNHSIATSKANEAWVSDSHKYTISRQFHDAGNAVWDSGTTAVTVVLTIKKATEKDIGVYSCVVDVGAGKSHDILKQEVLLNAAPHVKAFQSKSVTQGNALELDCPAWGWPLPQVTWYRDNVELVSNERVSFGNHSGIVGARLIITDMGRDPGDRAKYTCVASPLGTRPQLNDGSSRDGTNATAMVRIKGRFAVLWPLLGLAAEALILCVIITVYELRRNARLSKRSDSTNDLQQTNAATADQSKTSKSNHHSANSHGDHDKTSATSQDHSWQRKIN